MKINECFVLRKIKEENFLVPYKANGISRDVIYLNEVGAEVFKMASGCLDTSVLLDNVAETFGVQDDPEAKKQIGDFIDQVVSIGLLMDES